MLQQEACVVDGRQVPGPVRLSLWICIREKASSDFLSGDVAQDCSSSSTMNE